MPGLTDTRPAEVTFTLRQPPYSYLKVRVQSISSTSSRQPPPTLDEVTIRQYLAFAMQQYLGLTGAAVPIDVLKVEDQEAWVRVPYEDSSAVVAALSQWASATRNISLRVVNNESWLGARYGRSNTKNFWSLDD